MSPDYAICLYLPKLFTLYKSKFLALGYCGKLILSTLWTVIQLIMPYSRRGNYSAKINIYFCQAQPKLQLQLG